MSASQYERELRGILEGEDKVLSKITKSCTILEKDNFFKIKEKPFAVIRAAGSLGVDLVATRGDISFLTEVKTSFENTVHFSRVSGKLQDQADAMKKICEKTKTLPIYAFRAKGKQGDSWRIFTLNMEGLEGKIAILHKRLPKIKLSKNGNYIMKWEDGMPLSDFISYLCK
ncbi:MAG: Holliday junction resolvase [Candidatus Thermoplasmatota archaeon]|nr:Holliday junction resolvase [Candidatus Thermoplasmatota archaeon]